MTNALILGINGQDGSFLAEILLDKGYKVHGLIRRTAKDNLQNINNIINKIDLHYGDLNDPVSIQKVINLSKPKEIYNEADQDHAGISFDIPSYNFDVTGSAVGRILEIIKNTDTSIKFFQPVTSNMFGSVKICPQNEETPFYPLNPYACAKVFAYHLCRMYRKNYNMFISTATFYNHESERRTENYVTRKITKAAAKISLGLQNKLILGDITTKIDWGYAKEYMQAAWQIMQLDKPSDYIIGTGVETSVEEFVIKTFKYLNLDYKKYLTTSKKFIRPAKNLSLVADISKAKKEFGFEPKTHVDDLIKIMVDHDLQREKNLGNNIYTSNNK
jgi:GDPmannose 4,6-dehydratase